MKRFAVSITLYKKTNKSIENSIIQSIKTANYESEAIAMTLSSDLISGKLVDDWRIYWKVAMEIPEYDTERGQSDNGKKLK